MEQEFKWSTPDIGAFMDILAAYHMPEKPGTVCMDARYYDTPDGMVKQMHGGLRLRTEGTQSVCCLKLAASSAFGGALKAREEFECEAPDIQSGLHLLPQQTKAPADVCRALLDAGLVELGLTTFTRHAVLLTADGCTAELSFDHGELIRGGRRAPISEMELELKSGSAAAFEALGKHLQETFSLTPEPLSKLVRLMRL